MIVDEKNDDLTSEKAATVEAALLESKTLSHNIVLLLQQPPPKLDYKVFSREVTIRSPKPSHINSEYRTVEGHTGRIEMLALQNDKKCRASGKMHHFAKMCRSKEHSVFMYSSGSGGHFKNCELGVNGVPLNLLVDVG